MSVEAPQRITSNVSFPELALKAGLNEVEFLPVKNKVIWINPEISLPLNIRNGRPTPLGVFAHTSSDGLNPYAIRLEHWPSHSRSAFITRAFFADKSGRIYRDIDIKGAGAIKGNGYSQPQVELPGQRLDNGDRYGLMYEADARHDSEMAEFLTRFGVRTHRSLALIKLEEIVYGQKVISTAEAKRSGIIDGDSYVIQVRGYGTKARLAEYMDNVDENAKEAASHFLSDAITVVSKELGLNHDMTIDEYWRWFDFQFQNNLAILQKLNVAHRWITPHNVTLDARFVDLDDARTTNDLSELARDRRMAADTMSNLVRTRAPRKEEERKKLEEYFNKKELYDLNNSNSIKNINMIYKKNESNNLSKRYSK